MVDTTSTTTPATSMPISLRVLGAGRDVGRSCMLLTLPPRQILLDCGAHPGFSDHRRYPELHTLPRLDAIIITHFHFDHAAALPILTKHHPDAPVYMTEPTRELTRLMLHDVVTTSSSRRQHCPFSAADIDRSLSTVRILPLGDSIVGEDGDINVKTFYAGHVLGAVMVYITHAGKSAFYTGDFCTSPDRHLRSADVPVGLSTDVQIMEATYCQTTRKEARYTSEMEVAKAIIDTIKQKGKVLIPISAFGRAHTMCGLLDAHCAREIRNVPIYISGGLASRACKEYARFRDWWTNEECRVCTTGRKRKRGFSDICKHRAVDRLVEFGRGEWEVVTRRGPVILFATPGNLSTGLSLDVLRAWGRDDRNLVVVPGLTFASTVAGGLLDNAGGGDGEDGLGAVTGGGVRCKVINARFGAHADRRGLVRVIRGIRAGCVVLVHGNENGIMEFRRNVEKQLRVRCYAPRNGDTVVVKERDRLSAETRDDGIGEDLPEDWQDILGKYQNMIKHVRTEGT